MATCCMAAPPQPAPGRTIVGATTGAMYSIGGSGIVTIDEKDEGALLALGFVRVPGTSPEAGVAILDFGAFPGSPFATTTVPAPDASDEDAVIIVSVAPIATSDHSVDEHLIDPPMVNGYADGAGNIVINGMPSGRDLPVPPGTPFGNKAGSQMPTANKQCMPYGKWSVAWSIGYRQ